MQTRTKIRIDAVQEVQRALEAVPEYRQEEVTKTEAVRMLVPQIHAMQAKGYSLVGIAEMLSDKGIPMSAGALKGYLTEAKGRAGRRRPLTKKRAKEKPEGVARVEAVAPTEAPPATPPAPAPLSKGVATREEATGGPPEVKRAHARAASEGEGKGDRKSAFTPRDDSADI